MEILDVRDINFDELQMLDGVCSSESTLYFYDKFLYKFYDNLSHATLERKKKKLFLLNDGEVISDVVIPNVLIKNGDLIYGCVMEYIKKSKPLIQYKNSNVFILLLYVSSLSLKKIHSDPRNIVVGDLHLNNILIDDEGKHYFVDFDSCKVDGISQDNLPYSLMRYACDRDNIEFEASIATDKLCMLLSTVNALLGKNIDSFSMCEYDKKAERIQTLKNMREVVLAVKNNGSGIPDVPYLDEVISIKDFPAFKKLRAKGVNGIKY